MFLSYRSDSGALNYHGWLMSEYATHVMECGAIDIDIWVSSNVMVK